MVESTQVAESYDTLFANLQKAVSKSNHNQVIEICKKLTSTQL